MRDESTTDTISKIQTGSVNVGYRHKVRFMNDSKSRLMLKGLEDEVYTGLPDGRIVGVKERIDQSLPGFSNRA